MAPMETTGAESIDSYHSRNCKICRHEDRAAIEDDFLHWRAPEYIAREYNLSTRAIYRHAHAVGLYPGRRKNLRSSLETIIEGVGKAQPSADAILRAIEMYSRMNENGELVQVPKTQLQVMVISKDGHPVIPTIPGLQVDGLKLGGLKMDQTFLTAAPALQPEGAALSADSFEEQPAGYPVQLDTQCQTDFGLSH